MELIYVKYKQLIGVVSTSFVDQIKGDRKDDYQEIE